jgi:hypothetical protein
MSSPPYFAHSRSDAALSEKLSMVAMSCRSAAVRVIWPAR